jgi:hypothetical protein
MSGLFSLLRFVRDFFIPPKKKLGLPPAGSLLTSLKRSSVSTKKLHRRRWLQSRNARGLSGVSVFEEGLANLDFAFKTEAIEI